MKVLFDQGTPAPLRKALASHVVETANERGWTQLQNGDLIDAAEAAGFDVFVATDRISSTSLKYAKYAEHYLAAFAYRFNRRFDLRGLVVRLVVDVARSKPLAEKAVRARAEARYSSGTKMPAGEWPAGMRTWPPYKAAIGPRR